MTGPAADGPQVRAAGGVVWRPGAAGVEVCLVHRPKYDDWSLPKGKLESGEHPLAAAVREVAEETGVVAVPQVRLPGVGYHLPDGVPKTVDYWSMRATGEVPFTPNDEVDEVRWVPLPGAAALLTHERDTDLVRRVADLPPVTAVVVLLRHAYAGQRDEWTGPDRLRPLDPSGRRRAEALARLMALFGPSVLVSAAPVRCRQTLEPLAARLGLDVTVDGRFDEDADPGVGLDALRALAGAGGVTVLCSQGRLIPPLLDRLLAGATRVPAGRGVATGQDAFVTDKGDGWLLAFSGVDPAGVDRVTCPELSLT